MCAALSPGGIDVVADDTRTAFVPAERRIMVARQYLRAETPVAVGAVLHEIGHALITRYHLFVEPDSAISSVWLNSSNAAEEARDHCFLRRRLPGVRRYLRALFGADELPGVAELECELFAFLAAMAAADRFVEFPFLAPFSAAAATFARTAGARDRYNHALPPPDLMPRPGLSERYARDVSPVLRRPDEGLVDPVEAEILCAAAAARRIFVTEIWPEILLLIEDDVGHIARALLVDPMLREHAERRGRTPTGARLAREALHAWLKACGGRASPNDPEWPPVSDAPTQLHDLARAMYRRFLERKTAELSRFALATGDAEAASADPVAEADHDALVEVLRRALPRRPRAWVGGYRSGPRIDLPRVMRAAATQRDADRIWARRQVERPALAAMLLVDLSGSMRGDKVEAAIAATRSISRALASLRGVSWSVLGFQDVTIPVVGFEERIDDDVLSRIDAMRKEAAGRRPGGNNKPIYNDDGPCLEEAASVLASRPERDRLLLVISDGRPEGSRSGRAELHAAVAKVGAMTGMQLVGIGSGAGTDHVTEYYPVARANVEPSELAPTLGRLLAASINAAARTTAA